MLSSSESSKTSVLVTGATGAIGPAVVSAFNCEGFRIRTFSADVPFSGMLPENTEVMTGDVTDRIAVRAAMQGVDVVLHLAALLHIANPPAEMNEKYEYVNVRGTETVVKEAVKAGVKRIVFFSTIAVYGSSNGQALNELSDVHPDTIYARTKLAAEQAVMNARGADGRSLGTVLRLGAVYGPRIKGNYERLVDALARHRFVPIGNGLNRRTLVHDRDVARAALLAVMHPVAAGRIYNVTDGRFHTLNEIIQSICSALGRQPPRISLPLAPVRAIAGVLEKGCRFVGMKPIITREMVDKYTEDIAVEGKLIQQELGFVPRYDLQTGWEETIQEMQKRITDFDNNKVR